MSGGWKPCPRCGDVAELGRTQYIVSAAPGDDVVCFPCHEAAEAEHSATQRSAVPAGVLEHARVFLASYRDERDRRRSRGMDWRRMTDGKLYRTDFWAPDQERV